MAGSQSPCLMQLLLALLSCLCFMLQALLRFSKLM
jgi:hypothetical protein